MTRPVSAHRYLGVHWKPDGKTPHHRAVCMCGWVSTTADVGYGYAISHEADYGTHVIVASKEKP